MEESLERIANALDCITVTAIVSTLTYLGWNCFGFPPWRKRCPAWSAGKDALCRKPGQAGYSVPV